MNRNNVHNHPMHAFWANGNDIVNMGANYGITWNYQKGEWRTWRGNNYGEVATLTVDINHEHYYEGSNTTGSSGDMENRPSNYTIRVWKRIS